MPAAGTYIIIVNYERGAEAPLLTLATLVPEAPLLTLATLVPEAPKTSHFSACGRHLYHCELRERARVPFQSQKSQKILPVAGTYIIVN